MISAPLLLIGGPLLAAAVIYLVRRITLLASLLSAAGALALAWLLNAVPTSAEEAILGGRVTGGTQIILGRALTLSESDRWILIALSLGAALLLLLAIRLRPNDIFFPGLLALLGLASAALVVETFVFSVLAVEIAAGLVTTLLQGAQFGSTRGAWRFFLFSTLALPFLLWAAWQIDFQTANPGQSDLLGPAVLILTLGFTIYLAAIPFHLWLAPVAQEAHPLPQITAFAFFQAVTLGIILSALDQFPWLATSVVPFQWFTFLGSLTVGIGAVLAFSAGSFGRLAAYNLMVDMGALLLLLGLQNEAGLQAAWLLVLLRIINLSLWGSGLALLRRQVPSGQFDQARGLGWQQPWAAAALILGGLALAAIPLTPGFPGRWMAIGLVARESLGRASLLLLGSAGGMVGVLRAARHLFALPPDPPPPVASGRWRWIGSLALALVILGALVLALFPQPIVGLAEQIASQFSYWQ